MSGVACDTSFANVHRTGLSVHMSQVHKENLTAVDNALPNRAGLDIEIFGMEGIPEDIVQQHHQRVLTNFHQTQAERQAASGNASHGGQNANAPKKPKLEAVSDLKKRLAEHKAAKLAAEQETGGSSGGNTPNPTASGQTQPQPTSVSLLDPLAALLKLIKSQAVSPVYPNYQQPYAAPPTNGSYSQSPSVTQTPVSATAPYQAPPAFPLAGSPVQVGAYGQISTSQPGQLAYGQVPPVSFPQQSYAQPPQPLFQQQQQPLIGYPTHPGLAPPPFQVPYGGQFGQTTGPPRPFGAGSPVPGFPQQPPPQHHLPQRSHSPATNGSFPAPVRTGSVSLPSAPGLPQRPAFGAPPVNAFQFQQMHQGQIPAPQTHNAVPQYRPHDAPPNTVAQTSPPANVPGQPTVDESQQPSSLDDLIATASKQADTNAAATVTAPTATPPRAPPPTKEEAGEDKAAKKDKEKPKSTRLVYSDNETSPEEKMAVMARYAFTPTQKTIIV